MPLISVAATRILVLAKLGRVNLGKKSYSFRLFHSEAHTYPVPPLGRWGRTVAADSARLGARLPTAIFG